MNGKAPVYSKNISVYQKILKTIHLGYKEIFSKLDNFFLDLQTLSLKPHGTGDYQHSTFTPTRLSPTGIMSSLSSLIALRSPTISGAVSNRWRILNCRIRWPAMAPRKGARTAHVDPWGSRSTACKGENADYWLHARHSAWQHLAECTLNPLQNPLLHTLLPAPRSSAAVPCNFCRIHRRTRGACTVK